MNKLLLFISCFLSLGMVASGQSPEHDHDHDSHRHEIGIANAPVWFVKEKKLAWEFHLHYIHRIPETKFGIGLGYERIFDSHGHNTFGVIGNYSPLDRLNLAVAPGIAFDNEGDSHFTTHLETSYDFNLHGFHLGPAFEISLSAEDIHYSLGLHIGIGW